MLNLQLARKYAVAIFEIAQEENKLVAYGEELAAVKAAFASVPELKGFFANPQVETKAKKELMTKLFKEELSKVVFNFMMLLIDKRRIVLIDEIEAEYHKLSNKARGIVVADVITAMTMSSAMQKRLVAKLASVSGKEISLRMHEDKGLIGGVVVKVGDKRIDGSVAGRLQSLKAELMANN